MRRRGLTFSLVLMVLLVFSLHAGLAFAGVFVGAPVNISNNDAVGDDYARVSGDRVVWVSWATGDAEIFTWTPTEAAHNISGDASANNDAPQVSGDRVVWVGSDGADQEVWTWKAGDASPTNVSNNDSYDTAPQVSGDRIVWQGDDGDSEIYTWKVGDVAPTAITANSLNDYFPFVSGDRVVWYGDDGLDNEVYTWTPSGGAVPVTNTSDDEEAVRVSGDRLVWNAYNNSSAHYDIMTWKVGAASAVNLSNTPALDDYGPQVDGDRVVWWGFDGVDYEIYTWKAGDALPTNASNRDLFDDNDPQLAGDRVVWSGDDGADTEIFTWRVGDSAPLQVTDNTSREDVTPYISGSRVVWDGDEFPDASDFEIYTLAVDSAAPVVTPPVDASLVATNSAGITHSFLATATDAQGVMSLKYYVGSTEITSPHLFGLGVTTVRVEAKDAAGNTGTATFKVTVLLKDAIVLTASPSAPAYNSATTLTALLADAQSKPLAGASVVIERQSGGSWVPVTTATTGSGGTVSVKTGKLTTKQTYRARYTGSPTLTSAESTLSVYPKVKLSRSSSWKGRSLKVRYKATGYITPKHAASDKNKIKIRAYKKGSDGKYHYVKSFTAKYVYFSKTKTKYQATVKFDSKGSWAIRAYHPKDATHAATYGSRDYFKVR